MAGRRQCRAGRAGPRPQEPSRVAPSLAGEPEAPEASQAERGIDGPGGEAGVLDSPHGALALRSARAGSWEPARMGNKGQLQDLLQREMDGNRECPGLWRPSLGARRSGGRVFYIWKGNTTPV